MAPKRRSRARQRKLPLETTCEDEDDFTAASNYAENPTMENARALLASYGIALPYSTMRADKSSRDEQLAETAEPPEAATIAPVVVPCRSSRRAPKMNRTPSDQ